MISRLPQTWYKVRLSVSTSTYLTSLPAVQSGSVGLLEVVRALGEYITSPEDDVRRKGGFLCGLNGDGKLISGGRGGAVDGYRLSNTLGTNQQTS